MKLERQMDKLHELENILRSSDQLSPVTLGECLFYYIVFNSLLHACKWMAYGYCGIFHLNNYRIKSEIQRILKDKVAVKI